MQILSALSLQLAIQGESITDSGKQKKQLCRKSHAALSALSATTGTSTQRAEKALIASPELWQVNSNKIAAYRQKVQQINSPL